MQFESLGFAHDYAVEVDAEQFPHEEILYFTRQDKRACHSEGLGGVRGTRCVRVVTPARTWMGYFECGDRGQFDGVFATPSPGYMLVVAQSAGYWVPVKQPEDCRELELEPICAVRGFPTLARMVLLLERGVAGLSGSGVQWEFSEGAWGETLSMGAFEDSVVVAASEWMSEQIVHWRVAALDGTRSRVAADS